MVMANAVRFTVAPRDVPLRKVARLFSKTEAEFAAALPGLYARKFPAADPTLGTWDLRAVNKWMDLRHGELFANETANDNRHIEQQHFSAVAYQAGRQAA
jgi:hypothetical protein